MVQWVGVSKKHLIFGENARLESKNESNAFSSMRISDYTGKTDLSCGLARQKLIKTGIAEVWTPLVLHHVVYCEGQLRFSDT